MKAYLKAHKFLILIPVGIVLAAAITTALILHAYNADISTAYELKLSDTELMVSIRDTAKLDMSLEVTNEKMVKKAAKKLEEAVLTYTSADPDVLEVSDDGTITPKQEGRTEITVTYAELSAVCQVEVYIPLDDVKLDCHEMELNVEETGQVTAIIEPADATYHEEIVLSSDDPEIADVDESGLITAYGPGSTVIRMTCGEFEDFCDVTVYAPLKGVELESEDEMTLNRGETCQFAASVFPENTTDDKTITFSVSDENLASIDENGLLTAIAAGDVTVSAKAGDFEDSCIVHIIVPLEGIAISTKELKMNFGDSVQLPIAYFPADTTEDLTTEWTSSDENVASVSEDGTVKALNAGQTVITATCGEFTAECAVTVIIPVTSVTISQGVLTLLKGAGAQLYAAVNPDNTTEEKFIDWSSDNIEVAVVENGAVTAVGAGTAVITAAHGDHAASCAITVLSPMTGIEFEQNSLSIVETFSAPLSVICYPADTTDPRTVSFSSSDPSVATVNGDGVVTGVKVGTCKISAVVGPFGIEASVEVTPYVAVDSVTLSPTSLSFANRRDTARLTASVLPADASSTKVTYTSSNSRVATVSADGLVTAVGGGDCTITASCGGKSAGCSVHVAAPNAVVVLDPGHDSVHNGASYGGYREEIINMTVAQSCKAYLESHYAGVDVYLTRGDGPLAGALRDDLEARAQVAQNYGADILVSMHFNASVNHNASGCLAFVSKQGNVAGQCAALGNSILAQITAATGLGSHGCISTSSDTYFDEFGNPLDYYAINRHCANRGIPGIIVEHCFMDVDSGFLSNDWLNRFGVADAIGIANYLGLPAK